MGQDAELANPHVDVPDAPCASRSHAPRQHASVSGSVRGMLGVQADLILRAVQANWAVSSALRPSRSSVNSVCIF